MLALNGDGYIRLTLSELSALSMQQHMVWQDSDLRKALREQGVHASVAGYCEWASNNFSPQVSLGWAWFRTASGAAIMLAPGSISCNVMLCSEAGIDLGARQTAELLIGWLSSQSWQKDILTLH